MEKVEIKEVGVRFNCPANLALGHREYRGLENRVYSVPVEPLPEKEASDSVQELMKLVFKVNPVTKLPDGDISMYMSENTSPEIKNFIQQQFMSPHPASPGTSFDGLSDDELVALSRGSDESVNAYASRMRNLLYTSIKRRESQSKQVVSKSD